MKLRRRVWTDEQLESLRRAVDFDEYVKMEAKSVTLPGETALIFKVREEGRTVYSFAIYTWDERDIMKEVLASPLRLESMGFVVKVTP